MKTVIYSINKTGWELDVWTRELTDASNQDCRFVVFNHGAFLAPARYLRAQALDALWFDKNIDLLRMYNALEALIREVDATILIVDNCFPYHPEYLKNLNMYKVLRTSDGPMAAYDRDFCYVHAYDHILYHSRAYSPELTMPEKLKYVGASRVDFWPLALFDAANSPRDSVEQVMSSARDIDILFVGALHLDKMPALARVKKAFGRRCRLHGLANLKKNAYFNLRYGAPGWVKPIAFEDYVRLYRRSKIGFNVHLRGDYTVGGYRLFELPGNGVMQISDGGEYLDDFFRVPMEVERYADVDELIGKIDYYLTRDDEREEIASAGLKAVRERHRIGTRMRELTEILVAAKP